MKGENVRKILRPKQRWWIQIQSTANPIPINSESKFDQRWTQIKTLMNPKPSLHTQPEILIPFCVDSIWILHRWFQINSTPLIPNQLYTAVIMVVNSNLIDTNIDNWFLISEAKFFKWFHIWNSHRLLQLHSSTLMAKYFTEF